MKFRFSVYRDYIVEKVFYNIATKNYPRHREREIEIGMVAVAFFNSKHTYLILSIGIL